MSCSDSPEIKRFADYFVICGLDLRSGLEPDQLSGDSLHCTPLDRPYLSKVLAHYPDNVAHNPFEDTGVGMLCLPRGLSFCTQKHPREPHFHSFILTREDGSRTYGHSFTFYEEVTDQQICAAMQTLQAMHLTELSGSHPAHHRLTGDLTGGSRSLPRSFKLASPRNTSAGSLYDVACDTLYVSKSICLITAIPLVVACRTFLRRLMTVAVSGERPPLPLESYVYNLLYEVSVPPPGRTLRLKCVGQEVLCQRPGLSELPLFEYSFQEFFSILGVENALQLFTCVLLENQVLLFSQDYHRLMLVAECVTALLFPFTWQHVYVPILPSALQHFLDAPVPYIMGLNHGSDDRSHLTIPGEANLCFVDIDNREVEVPEDIPRLPCKHELIGEIHDTLTRYGVVPQTLDRNLNERGSSRRSHSHARKHSWSFESGDSGLSSTDSSARSSYSSLASTHAHILQQSEAMQRITAVAKRAGVINSLEDLGKPRRVDGDGNVKREPSQTQKYLDDLKLNNAIREIFVNRFVHMFASYDHFIIAPDQQDVEQWLSSRETMQTFDKTVFLSDQPEPHLPFLSRFIETQMFVSLIDKKFLSHCADADPGIRLFDTRISLLRVRHRDSMVRTSSYMYEPCSIYRETEAVIEDRSRKSDLFLTSPSPKRLELPTETPIRGFFPILNAAVLNREPPHSRSKKRSNAQWRRRDRQAQHLNSDQREKYMQEARSKLKHPKLSSVSPASIAQTNWKFVEALLKECTMRTKRMLVEKMGEEAVELGHSAVSITGLEENTLIASLCDLLERVWAHGVKHKQGKSALWSHLLSFLEVEECKSTGKPIDPNFLTPACPEPCRSFGIPEIFLSFRKTGAFTNIVNNFNFFDISNFALDADLPRRDSRDKKKNVRTPDMPSMKPLPTSLVYDVKNVQAIAEIKSEIGYARAWVRLALEKKLLSKHLKRLLSNHDLLRSLYKRYAFLRCDEEKEQFLYHLLTLNAVDYSCFTNTFTNITVPYRVVIFPSRKFSAATTSANAWLMVGGHLCETGVISLPRQTLEIVFQHKNLGMLTTLRIGHDNSGISSKWMVEHVVVRNDISGQAYKFPCGRWLGRGVDDGSTERLLVGERVPLDQDNDELMETCRTPPRCRSPSMPRRPSDQKLSVPEIQQMLGDAVNNIVKYYYKSEKERGSLTILLCGELGLVYCLEQVFFYGFKATRFFRQIYLWDFIVKVRSFFEGELQEEEPMRNGDNSHEHVLVMRSFCTLVDKIDRASYSVGKDGKFQLFVCCAARDRMLHRMILHVASSHVTATMYEDRSFLRDPNLVTFLVQILESLADFDIVLETSLTKGIE